MTLGKQQQWLDSQPEPKSKSETQELSTSTAAY
jgi:hypothetical protein